MEVAIPNLLQEIPESLPEELVDVLVHNRNVRIERIVSMGQASAEGFWYDQAESEWIAVLQGAARLEMEGGRLLNMKAGDYLLISAHEKHRVDWTTPDVPTVWLAVFFAEE